MPAGTFGSRLDKPSVHAKARYIDTCLDEIAEYLFRPEDTPVLEFLEEEGQRVEPQFFCPLIPLVLVNGSFGIATGWSSFVPNHDPLEVIARSRLHAQEQDAPTSHLLPWYRGYGGSIQFVDPSNHDAGFVCEGHAAYDTSTCELRITELPVGRRATLPVRPARGVPTTLARPQVES